MATVKPVARIGIPSTFAFPDPEALHAKDSWPDSLRWSANVPGDLCAISSKGKASENKKNLWQKIMYLLRRRFCASNRFAYVNRSTTRAVSFDLPAIKKSTPGDPAHLEARNKIQMLDKERRLLHLRYKPYAETPIPDGHALTKKCEIRQTNQSLLDDCYKLKVALGNDRSRTIGLDALITACQSL